MISWIVIGIVALFSIGCYTKFKLRKLDFQCKHVWKTVDISALINDKNEKIGNSIIQQCVHCGEVHSKDLDGMD